VDKIGGLDNTFDPADTFTGHPVDDLDLFLVPSTFVLGVDDPYAEAVALSVSSEDNVEHIYADVEPGNYSILVYQPAGDEVDYGLAWWTGDPADFDQDGDVDGDDLVAWKADFGGGAESDADFDTDSDGNDLLVWQRNLGAGIPATPAVAFVPEPGMISLCCLALPLLTMRRRR
jgi:hypothetical protein